MSISVNSFLASLGEEYAKIDLDKIQALIDGLALPHDAALRKDPNTFMLEQMRNVGMTTPDGLHFHRRENGELYPPEPENCVPPETCLVLGAAPGEAMDVEQLRIDSPGGSAAKPKGRCDSCWICIIIRG